MYKPYTKMYYKNCLSSTFTKILLGHNPAFFTIAAPNESRPPARMKISVSTDISVIGFYGYIGYIGYISVYIFT